MINLVAFRFSSVEIATPQFSDISPDCNLREIAGNRVVEFCPKLGSRSSLSSLVSTLCEDATLK